jgi:hypothetical protein
MGVRPRQTGRLTIGHNLISIWTLVIRQRTDLTSRQRGCLTETELHCQTVTNIWSWAPDGSPHLDTMTDWHSVITWLWLAWNSVDSTSSAYMNSKRRPAYIEEWGVPASLLSPVKSDSGFPTAAAGTTPTRRSSLQSRSWNTLVIPATKRPLLIMKMQPFSGLKQTFTCLIPHSERRMVNYDSIWSFI